MTHHKLERLVHALSDPEARALLASGRRVGLEKESLRVDSNIAFSSMPHPRALGSALTHPYLTTDYSEAQIELITPPLEDNVHALAFLEDLQTYVHQHLDDEILWANSMPCVFRTEENIPLAQYGSSNSGRMKNIYRRGLGYRYGRAMQVISGAHFNYSFNPKLWPLLCELTGNGAMRDGFSSSAYMALARNLLRLSWVIPYLFGDSPAVCRTFAGAVGGLEYFDPSTVFGPYATSLRMGGIGYQNNQEAKIGVSASYNSLDDYVASLEHAVSTPYELYEKIGVKVDGNYRQLNANVLQIENEYYATVRPKRTTRTKTEMPLLALHRAGVEYIELRSLDVNTLVPAGLCLEQLDFLEVLLLYCLLEPSPPIDEDEQARIRSNEMLAAHEGRTPGLRLACGSKSCLLSDWGDLLCRRMAAVSELLDAACATKRYGRALLTQQALFKDPQATPSAVMLAEMRARNESFAAFVLRQSETFHRNALSRTLASERRQAFDRLAGQSLADQERLESEDKIPLDEYIRNYFAQLNEIRAAQR